jgi:hypothetical protein
VKPSEYTWLSNIDGVKSAITRYQSTTRKNILNAIVVALGAIGVDDDVIQQYSNLRDEEHKNYEKMVANHEKSDKQSDNWMEMSEIDVLLKRLRRGANEIYNRKKVYNVKKDYPLLQQYITLLTYRHIPMRNDVANMKVITQNQYSLLSKEEQESNNYLIGGNRKPYYFQINDYKTKKTFGQKKIEIPSVLNTEIKRWLKFNDSGYYITNATRTGGITPNGITKLLTTLFREQTGKNISTSMIRHIYLSDKYKAEIEKKKEKEKDSHAMGHSLAQQMDYVKK